MSSLVARWCLAPAAALLVVLAAGCTWIPADVRLAPEVLVPNSTPGAGTTLSFRFIDDRDDTTVGHRGLATIGAKISAMSLPQVIDSRLRKILEVKGYKLVQENTPADASVTFRLRAFKYEVDSGWLTHGKTGLAALSVEARRGARSYETVYRSNNEDWILLAPSEQDISDFMNVAMNDILKQAAWDNGFDRFTTKDGGPVALNR